MSASPSPSPPAVTAPALSRLAPRRALAIILTVSAGAFLFLAWLVFLRPASGGASAIVDALPACDAGFNALSAILLVAGLRAVLRRDYVRHLRLMSSAFASSVLFLVCYVIYHGARGDVRFLGAGWIRPVYFTILISHIVLSAAVLPLILASFYLSLSGRFPLHRRVSRYTFPIWLYVSVTGVVVFAMLKTFNR
ncbi:MAG: DUF420 domain-containing protein [Opitutaceae bacterium]